LAQIEVLEVPDRGGRDPFAALCRTVPELGNRENVALLGNCAIARVVRVAAQHIGTGIDQRVGSLRRLRRVGGVVDGDSTYLTLGVHAPAAEREGVDRPFDERDVVRGYVTGRVALRQ